MQVKEYLIVPPSSTRRPRVLHLTSSAQIGGTERMLLRFLERRDRRKFQHVVVAMQPEGPLLDALRKMEIDATGLPSQNPFGPGARGALRAILAKGDTDLVHAYGLRADVLARGIAHKAGIRAYVSAIRSPDPWRRMHHVWIDRWTARGGRVDLFISNSEAGRLSRIRREKFPPDRIVTIHNGIELPAPPISPRGEPAANRSDADLRARYQIPERAPLIVVVSNLRPMKGHFDLIGAIARMDPRFAPVRFVFAGRDDCGGLVAAAAQEAGVLDRIVFCGFVPDPLPLVRMADVYCMPSHWEGCPVALLEAMALERPIVATNVGGIPELVRHEQEALLVPPAAPGALAAAVVRLLSDGQEARRLGRAAGERARAQFSIERMVERIESAYAWLLF